MGSQGFRLSCCSTQTAETGTHPELESKPSACPVFADWVEQQLS